MNTVVSTDNCIHINDMKHKANLLILFPSSYFIAFQGSMTSEVEQSRMCTNISTGNNTFLWVIVDTGQE